MLFKWSERAVKIQDYSVLRLNKFILKKIEHENRNLSDGGGHMVILILTLQREYGYYVYQVTPPPHPGCTEISNPYFQFHIDSICKRHLENINLIVGP